MKDDIEAVRDNLFRIVDRVAERTKGLHIRFGIVSYRDHPPQDRTYVTRVFDFTDKIKAVHREISDLSPSEGGDVPEAVADGLYDARTKLSWQKDSYKALLLIGDAPPHGRNYNMLADDYFPEGCPDGHDPRSEVQTLKRLYGNTMFIFVCGCNPLVEQSFRSIADSVEGGRYYSLTEAHQLPEAILGILEDMGELIEADRRVLAYYISHDAVFDIGEAATELGLELRAIKTSLSRLIELEHIPSWPSGRPLTQSQTGLTVELGNVPSSLVPGKSFPFKIKIRNPSLAHVGIRVVATLITSQGVSEMMNEPHEISPRADETITIPLTPMSDERGKASLRVEVLCGSKTAAVRTYQTMVI
ncbi:MAG: hypothetical protein C4K47_08885 [Candidatus Thorarchaeota archaeon]|nr:MAG: hypothetical protein C4K47_08885 [Candidatus Thorarchaeota archaeon]